MKILDYINIKKAAYCIMMICLVFMIQSCFTGVEGTSKITLSKKELSQTAPSEEERFMADISLSPLKDWAKGKMFIVADEKFKIVAEGEGNNLIHKGDTVFYEGLNSVESAGGGESSILIFQINGKLISYPLEKSEKQAGEQITVANLPMLLELDQIHKVRSKLLGKELWTKTTLWYNDSLQYKKGKKFDRIKITEIAPGTAFFPILVKFTDEKGEEGNLLMSQGNTGNDSRSFGKLFSLSNPRNAYRHISDENWNAIQSEELRVGMTKEESRLSKGNPSDIDTGHNYSNAMEIWYYPNGSYIRFVDGLVINFK